MSHFNYDKWPSDCCLPTCEQLSAIAWLKQVTFRWYDDDVRYVTLKWWTTVGFYILVCIYVVICRDTVDLLYLIIIYYVLLNTRLRLVLLDHVTCNYLWQYNLWWNHYWLCDGYDQNSRFHCLNFKKHEMSCSTSRSCVQFKFYQKRIWNRYLVVLLQTCRIMRKKVIIIQAITLCDVNSRKWVSLACDSRWPQNESWIV